MPVRKRLGPLGNTTKTTVTRNGNIHTAQILTKFVYTLYEKVKVVLLRMKFPKNCIASDQEHGKCLRGSEVNHAGQGSNLTGVYKQSDSEVNGIEQTS